MSFDYTRHRYYCLHRQEDVFSVPNAPHASTLILYGIGSSAEEVHDHRFQARIPIREGQHSLTWKNEQMMVSLLGATNCCPISLNWSLQDDANPPYLLIDGERSHTDDQFDYGNNATIVLSINIASGYDWSGSDVFPHTPIEYNPPYYVSEANICDLRALLAGSSNAQSLFEWRGKAINPGQNDQSEGKCQYFPLRSCQNEFV